jgi:hypothetical protein
VAYEGLRLDRGVTPCEPWKTPSSGSWSRSALPNSIANFLFSHFPSPAPTSNIRDTGQPVAGLQTQNILTTDGGRQAN